jgi:hypothetical protein
LFCCCSGNVQYETIGLYPFNIIFSLYGTVNGDNIIKMPALEKKNVWLNVYDVEDKHESFLRNESVIVNKVHLGEVGNHLFLALPRTTQKMIISDLFFVQKYKFVNGEQVGDSVDVARNKHTHTHTHSSYTHIHTVST